MQQSNEHLENIATLAKLYRRTKTTNPLSARRSELSDEERDLLDFLIAHSAADKISAWKSALAQELEQAVDRAPARGMSSGEYQNLTSRDFAGEKKGALLRFRAAR